MKINRLLILASAFLSFNSLALIPNSTSNLNVLNEKKILRANEEIDASIKLIKNKDDLLDLISNCNTDAYSKNKTFELVQDIDLEGETIKPIPIFDGTLNGNNHTIKNFVIDSKTSGSESGFIRLLTENGIIKNLTIDSKIEVKNNETSVGGFVGTNKGLIENCSFKGNIKGRHIVGGLVGENDSTGKVVNAINEGNINGKTFSGGIVGFNKGIINKSTNKGIVNNLRFSSTDELTLSNIGGISGFNQYKIDECSNYGEVGQKQSGGLVGGISGSSIGQINNCNNYGEIKGDINIGGIVGYYAEFSNDDKDPTIVDIIELAKKILGDKNKEIKEPTTKIGATKSSSLKFCLNNGEISGNRNVGGVVGYSSNATTGLDKRIFDVNNCINEGYIQGNKENVGGIAGNHLNSKIVECFNTGNIDGKTADYVGGIVGRSNGEVAYTFAINDMIGNMYVGGIGGFNNKLHDCYTVSKIESKNNFIGALSGSISEIKENVSNNYYVNDDFYGIDNIDFENKSTKITKEDLASTTLDLNLNPDYFVADSKVRSYPKLKSFLELDETLLNNKDLKAKTNEATKFGSYVNFIDENGDIIKRILVEYNKDLDLNEIPEVPQKDGYFAKWSEFDNKNIVKNLYIKPIYNQIITTLASLKGPNAPVLVEGKFYETTKVEATINEKNILDKKSKYTYLKTIQIDIVDEVNHVNKEGIKYKFLLPEKYEKAHVATYVDNKLKILNSKIDGRYIVIDGLSNDTYYLLDEKFANWNNPWFITTIVCSSIGGALLIGGATFGIIYCVKKKKGKLNK